MKLLPSLLAGLKAVCAAFPDSRRGRGGNIAVADFGLSAFAMFFLAEPFVPVLSTCSGERPGPVELPESVRHRENSVRQLHPRHARRSGPGAARTLLRASGSSAGRRRCARRLADWVAERSSPGMGPSSFARKSSAARIASRASAPTARFESYHSMLAATVVAPGHAKIVPLMPEFIAPQDGAEKQDCERNAGKRWFDKHHARLAPLRPIYLGDDLFACQPIAAMVKDNGGDFIFTAKESSHTALYDFIKGAEAFRHDEKVRKAKTTDTFRYRWFEAVPLRDGKDAMLVNWIGFEIIDAKRRVKYSMAWVTSLPVTKQNVAEIVACGRTRWKIENEGFNVMKNHGYEFEHNFGHGQRFLAMMLASLNLLAFAWHTLLELLEPPWIAAREAAAKRTSFIAHLATITAYAVFPSWAVFLEALTTFTIPPELMKIQKNE